MTWREGQEEKEYYFEVYYNFLLFFIFLVSTMY